MKTTDKLLLGGLGVALYFLWKEKEKFEEAADDYIAKPIADAWIGITMPGMVRLTGTAIFKDTGYRISMSQLNIDPTTLTFMHLGQRYRIDHREGDNYIVVPA